MKLFKKKSKQIPEPEITGNPEGIAPGSIPRGFQVNVEDIFNDMKMGKDKKKK